jgi:hypothetical protein
MKVFQTIRNQINWLIFCLIRWRVSHKNIAIQRNEADNLDMPGE